MKNIAFILFIVLIGCKSPTDKTVVSNSTELEKLKTNIDSLFNSQINENAPGAALLVSYNSEMLISKGYGLRDVNGKHPITSNTNIRMASVSKQFTALCILSLVDKGVLNLNDSLNKYWNYPVFKNITINHLLNHTSGIADYEEYFNKNWDRNKIVENKNILEWLSTNPRPVFEVGKNWEYSNTAYLVLALLVEKLSGKEFSSYAQENVFKKAGMENTTFFNLAKPVEIKERAFCYDKDSLGNWKKIDGFYMNGVLGDGAVYTSINDFHKYNNALQEQSIVSEEMHKLIFQPSSMVLPEKAKYQFNFLNNAEERYAMGWFVTEKIALHTGSWNGTRTIVVKEFTRPLTIAIFLNFASSDTRTKLIEETYELVDEYIKTTANTVYKK
ncbi:MAG: beta-lactamase family protein [Fluviicola sp.]|nr:beta-lactamase family protein [Fluviicola sp.]